MSFLCWIQFARGGDLLGDCCFSLKFFWMFVFLLFCFYLLLCCSASLLLGLSAYLLFLVFYLPSLNKHQETLYVNTP